MTKNPLTLALATTAIAILALTGCSAQAETSEDPNDGADSTLSPTEQLEADAGVTVEPGLATCEFNNELDEHQWDGSGEYAAGTLDTAEIRETEDAYEVTMTGDFIDPPTVLGEHSRLSFTVTLSTDELAESASLTTEYDDGEITFNGVTTDDDNVEQGTNAELEQGTFTATYPKDGTGLEELDPTLWVTSVYFDDGGTTSASDAADDANKPVSFRCGDGRSWTWQALDSE